MKHLFKNSSCLDWLDLHKWGLMIGSEEETDPSNNLGGIIISDAHFTNDII